MATIVPAQGLLPPREPSPPLGAIAQVLAAVLEPQRNGQGRRTTFAWLRTAGSGRPIGCSTSSAVFLDRACADDRRAHVRRGTRRGLDQARPAVPDRHGPGRRGGHRHGEPTLKEIADSSATRPQRASRDGYVATFDGMSDLTDALVFGALIALALYFGAIATGDHLARRRLRALDRLSLRPLPRRSSSRGDLLVRSPSTRRSLPLLLGLRSSP